MADIKISELPSAGSVNDSDIFVMDQGLVTKTATRSQITASVTPASIGAMAIAERGNYIETAQLGAINGVATLDGTGKLSTNQIPALTTAQIAQITPAGIGAVATSDIISIPSGGTGATSQQAALNALAGAVTSNQVLKGNGTNVTLSALTSADIPLLGISQVSGAITTAQIYALTGDVVSSIGNPATTVVKLQGSAVATTSPSSGQVLAWDGTQWAPATASTGGGGGANGLTYYLNQGTAADAPTTNIPNTPHQLGRTGETGQTSITTGTLTQNTWVLVAGFVSESTPVDPATTTIPAGLWDFNIWAFGDANIAAGTSIRARAYTYDGTTLTLLGTSGGQVINGTSAQFSLSVLVPQTTVALTDRIYIAIEAFATGNNHTVTAQFGDGTPSHVHTSLPLVGGTGLWKNASGVLQSPASLLVDADVDAAAAITYSKLSGVQATLSSTAPLALTAGGTGATTQISALAALGAQPALTTAAPLALTLGGTGAITAQTALNSLAATQTSGQFLRGNGTNVQMSAIQTSDVPTLNQNTSGTAAGLSATLAVTSGGTGSTSAQVALNTLAGAVTANQVLRGNGTNVTLSALTTSDIPTLPFSKVTGVAASGANTDITSVALTTGTVSTTPSAVTDIVNKAYADAIGSGINFHDACNYATVAAFGAAYTYSNGTSGVGATITANAAGTLTIDGYTLLGTDVGKRLLIKNESGSFVNNTTPSAAFNGVYTLTTAGTGAVPFVLTRSTDYDTSGSGTNEIQAGDFLLVLDGSTLANTAWVQQTRLPITVGSTSLSFIQFAAAASGVTSFVTTLNGLTPNTTPVNGAVSLAGTLGISSGGTGQTSQQAALNALAGSQANGYHFRSDGTNVTLGAMNINDVSAGTLGIVNGGTGATDAGTALFNLGCPAHYVVVRASGGQTPVALAGSYTANLISSTTVTLTVGNTSLFAVGMTFSATSLRNFAIASIVDSTTFTISGIPTVLGSTVTSVYNTTNSTFTYAAGPQTALEGRTVVVGDVVLFSGQTQTTTMGPWVCTVQGAAGVPQVMTRPSWFTGTGYPIACTIQRGNVSAGSTYSIYQVNAADSDLAIGQVSLAASLIAARGAVAVLGGNLFTGKNTLFAGSATVNPLSFQAGAVLTTPQAHAVEWDGTQMYVSNTAAERLAVATSKVQINAQTGTTYTFAAVDAGYLVTAANAAAIAVTVPLNATIPLPIGTQILLMQLGAGQVTVAGSAGVTVSGKNGLKTSGQYAVISLIKIATDAWVLGGDAAV